MSVSTSTYVWSIVAILLVALAVPWFMWGSSQVVAGLPLWVWWHIGWMVLTAGVFYVFVQTAWGLGVESRGETDG
jgi:hypothetical protein